MSLIVIILWINERNYLINKEKIENLIESEIALIKKEYQGINGIDAKEDLYINKCDLLQAVTYYRFSNLGFIVYPISTQNVISNDVEGHNLILIEYQDLKYLIDLTYKQFFQEKKINEDNYIVDYEHNLVLLAPLPGYYYKLYPDKTKVADDLINKGYIEATDENLKTYFDSFYLTRRGKISNQNLPCKSNIKGSTYLNAIKAYPNDLSYSKENLLWLGFSNIDNDSDKKVR